MVSSTPVTVTVCGTFQFVDVKVTSAVLSVPSSRLLLVTVKLTLAVGAVFNTTVNVAVPPASEVFPLMAPTLMAAVLAVATTLAANSDVPPKLPAPKSWVAVALTAWPAATLTPLSKVAKGVLPVASVVTLTKPKYTWPSP